MYTEEQLKGLKRGELQAVAKEHGVKANMKVCVEAGVEKRRGRTAHSLTH